MADLVARGHLTAQGLGETRLLDAQRLAEEWTLLYPGAPEAEGRARALRGSGRGLVEMARIPSRARGLRRGSRSGSVDRTTQAGSRDAVRVGRARRRDPGESVAAGRSEARSRSSRRSGSPAMRSRPPRARRLLCSCTRTSWRLAIPATSKWRGSCATGTCVALSIPPERPVPGPVVAILRYASVAAEAEAVDYVVGGAVARDLLLFHVFGGADDSPGLPHRLLYGEREPAGPGAVRRHRGSCRNGRLAAGATFSCPSWASAKPLRLPSRLRSHTN